MTDDRPLHLLSLAPKRYVKARLGPHGWEVVGGTEHSLGGGVADPPLIPGRDGHRRHFWTFPVAAHALDRASAESAGEPVPRFDAPWDGSGVAPFPVLRRFSPASPRALDSLPDALGAHPFAPIVEGHPDQLLGRHAAPPVALDPGTDLADWTTLAFHDGHGPVRATTSEIADSRTVPLQTLGAFAERWAEPRSADVVGEVVVHERLIRRVGRGGALIDAQLAGGDPDLDDLLVIYREVDAAGFVADEVHRLGPMAFAVRYDVALDTVKSWASARKAPSPAQARTLLTKLRTIDAIERVCALDGCVEPVTRPNAVHCSKAHRDAAYRLRKKARLKTPGPTRRGRPRRQPGPDPFADHSCPGCGTVLLGAAASGDQCPVCALIVPATRKDVP